MEQQLFADIPITERLQHLKDNAFDTEQQRYKRTFTNEELIELRKEYAEAKVEQRKNKAERANKIKAIKSEDKLEEAEVERVLSIISDGFEEIKGDVFIMVDHKTGMTGYYDAEGRLISSRRSKPEERQLNFTSNQAM